MLALPLLYVGTYTTLRHAPLKASGIYAYQVNLSTGALTLAHKLPKVTNPSYLAIHPGGRFICAVIDVATTAGAPGGGVSSFSIDPDTGALRYLNNQPSHGTNPCHLSFDRSGRYLLVANYGSGTVAIYPIEGDGWIGPASDIVQHAGSMVNSKPQSGPHPHSITVDPGNRYALVPDLGLDCILTYRVDLERGKLLPNEPSGVTVAPGAGPRHLDFHPSGRYVYALNELASSIGSFAYDESSGRLRELQTLSTLPEGFSGPNLSAAIHVAPSGRFVYTSNRGHDSIAGFAIDQSSGRLALVGWESTRGQTPRDFAIDPSGAFLLVANQDTCTVVAFQIDPDSGQLRSSGASSAVPTPVCLKFLNQTHMHI